MIEVGEPAATSRFFVEPPDAGQRLDLFLAARVPALSRSRLKALIEAGAVLVDGDGVCPALILKGGEEVALSLPPPRPVVLVA